MKPCWKFNALYQLKKHSLLWDNYFDINNITRDGIQILTAAENASGKQYMTNKVVYGNILDGLWIASRIAETESRVQISAAFNAFSYVLIPLRMVFS